MPFVSQAQRGYMYANHPKIAKEFEKATPKGKKLPKRKARMGDALKSGGMKVKKKTPAGGVGPGYDGDE